LVEGPRRPLHAVSPLTDLDRRRPPHPTARPNRLLWFRRGVQPSLAAASDVVGLLFFELLFPSFRSLFASLFTFPNEYRMLTKERPSGMYRLSAYYAGRTLADLPIEVIFPSLFVLVVYVLSGEKLERPPLCWRLRCCCCATALRRRCARARPLRRCLRPPAPSAAPNVLTSGLRPSAGAHRG